MEKMILKILFLISVAAAISFSQNLQPGDGIRITFYNISEQISGDYYIEKDGSLQLPYLGALKTADRPFTNIKEEIYSKYGEYYREPELAITPLIRINIHGEVNKPGFYYVTGIEKLSGVMAMAGGETSDADLNDMYIIRDGEEIELDGDDLIADGNTVKDIGLQSGDRVVVPRQWWVTARNTAVIVSGLAVLVTIISLFTR